MSLRAFDRLKKSIGFRLTLLSSAFFVAGTFVILAFTYYLLLTSLQVRDRDSINARLQQLAAQYQATDLAGLKEYLALEARFQKVKPFFIRIAGNDNRLTYMQIPDQWSSFDLTSLEQMPFSDFGSIARLPATDDEAVLEVASLRLPDNTIIQVGRSTEERDDILRRFAWILATVVFPVLALGIIGGVLFAKRSLRPIRELIDAVRAINAGAMATRVEVRNTGDELDELASLFNGMLNRIETLIEGMRGALDNVAHELRTPVARIRGIAEIALQTSQGPTLEREALSNCIEESDHLLRLLDTLMDISEAQAGTLSLKPELLNIASLLESAVDLYRHVAEEKAIGVSIEASPGLWLIGDRSRLRQVMANLLDNAIKFTPSGGQIDLKATRLNSDVVISVSDSGIGISSEELERIWDRLYRGNRGRSFPGMGLGLSLVLAIVEAHGGEVEASSSQDGGSTFKVILPCASMMDYPSFPVDRLERPPI